MSEEWGLPAKEHTLRTTLASGFSFAGGSFGGDAGGDSLQCTPGRQGICVGALPPAPPPGAPDVPDDPGAAGPARGASGSFQNHDHTFEDGGPLSIETVVHAHCPLDPVELKPASPCWITS